MQFINKTNKLLLFDVIILNYFGCSFYSRLKLQNDIVYNDIQ